MFYFDDIKIIIVASDPKKTKERSAAKCVRNDAALQNLDRQGVDIPGSVVVIALRNNLETKSGCGCGAWESRSRDIVPGSGCEIWRDGEDAIGYIAVWTTGEGVGWCDRAADTEDLDLSSPIGPPGTTKAEGAGLTSVSCGEWIG